MLINMTIVLLEMLAGITFLCLLLHQQERLGTAAAVMAAGVMTVFGYFLSAAEVVTVISEGWIIDHSEIIIYLPVLAFFLLVYVLKGVLSAQRLLFAVTVAHLLYLYFAMLSRMQCTVLPATQERAILYLMFSEGRPLVNISAVTHLISLLLAPGIYSMLRNRHLPRTIALIGGMYGGQLLGFIPTIVLCLLENGDMLHFRGTVLAEIPLILLLGLYIGVYLRKKEREIAPVKPGAFDFIFAFFGSYGKVKELEVGLKEWENRYRFILQQSADAIVIADREAKITDRNVMAGRLFGNDIRGKNLFSLLLPEKEDGTLDTGIPENSRKFRCRAISQEGRELYLDATLTAIRLRNNFLLTLMARDVTEEVQFAREKEELTEQLMHSRRLESLGMLAGGVAHDFNNYIHAILGHVDVASMLDFNSPDKLRTHLDKIAAIAEKAAKLTAQLLGFARKGKYNPVELELTDMIDECLELLGPQKLGKTRIDRYYGNCKRRIIGDAVQIRQVFMNLLVNALDAMRPEEPHPQITITITQAVNLPVTPVIPEELAKDFHLAQCLGIAIADNGIGMTEEVKKRLFQPFFTTKPQGRGTGMGLAMVYGTIVHHHGWVQAESREGIGTTFFLYIPEVRHDAEK